MFNDMQYSARNQISNFMYAVYAWVAVGLSLAAGTAYAIASSPTIFIFFMKNPLLLLGIIVVQFMAIMGFSAYLQRMSFPAAMVLFVLLTASYGFTFSTIFAVYTAVSIVTTFVVTAATFLVMAAYGYLTRSDLTSVGAIATMIL